MATSARPSVHRIRSAGTASDSEVGFDIGRITGRAQCAAMSLITGSVNAPDRVDVPIRIVGCTRRTTSASPVPPIESSRCHPATSASGRAYRRCAAPRPGVAVVSRPARSTAQNLALARSSGSPSASIAAVSWSAMPVPAVPAPKITTRCSARPTPVALAAASTAARLTAPVPWMSSLNESV